jgi:hypothetical protein
VLPDPENFSKLPFDLTSSTGVAVIMSVNSRVDHDLVQMLRGQDRCVPEGGGRIQGRQEGKQAYTRHILGKLLRAALWLKC